MKIFIIADCHFGHEAMEGHCSRPHGFEFKILKNIGDLDSSYLLINLGDFCWNSYAHWNEQYLLHAHCKNWITIGNHDDKNAVWFMSHGWNWAGDYCRITYKRKQVLFSHLPIKFDGSFDLNIHGHFHNSDPETIRRVEPELSFSLASVNHHLYSVELFNYRPIELSALIENCPQ